MLLSLYSHYYSLFLLALANLLVAPALLHARAWRYGLLWLASQLAVCALYLPWLVYARRIALSYTPFRQGLADLLSVSRDAIERYSVGASMPPEQTSAISWGFLAIGAAGLWYASRPADRRTSWLRWGFVAGYALVPVTFGFLVSLLRPMFQVRYLMVSAPAFSLALGLGVAGLYRWRRPLGILAGVFLLTSQLVSLGNYYTDPRFAKTDFPAVITYVREHSRPGDGIVLDGWSQTFQFWYYYRLRGSGTAASYVFPLSRDPDWAMDLGRLDEIMSRHQGVWLLDYDVGSYDPQRALESHLARNYYPALYRQVATNRVAYYASPKAGDTKTVPLHLVCNQEIILKSYEVEAGPAKPGEVVNQALRWQAIGEPTRDYGISWRLRDPSGRSVVQRDSQPAAGFAPSQSWSSGAEVADRYGMPLPSHLLPGQYSVAIVVYDRASGAPCEMQQNGKPLPPGTITLTSIEVLDSAPVPSIDKASPSQSASFTFGGLRLVGYHLGPGPYRPGETIPVQLWWQVDRPLNDGYSVAVGLASDDVASHVADAAPVGPFWWPASRWQSGRLLVTYADLVVPPRTAFNRFRLHLVFSAPGVPSASFTGSAEHLVVTRDRSYEAPTMAYPTKADFSGAVALLGYDLEPGPGQPLRPGQELKLTLYWKAQREISESLKVFVHLVGEDGGICGQADAFPLGGNAPTNGWVESEVLVDSYTLSIKPDAPSGRYRLLVGFYEPTGGSRLPLTEGGDSARLAEVIVAGS